jgi:hypothetical protein
MRKIPLALEDTEKIVEGLEIYLKGLYEIGERGFTIQIVQGHLGQFLTARTYLEKGYKVWWTHPDYDLQVEEVGRIEVKTAKCWSNDGKSDANVFGLDLNKFDMFNLVLINDRNKPFKIFSIPKDELKECEKPHNYVVGNKQSPSFVYYDSKGLRIAEKEGYEIYQIEKKVALFPEKYLVWSR